LHINEALLGKLIHLYAKDAVRTTRGMVHLVRGHNLILDSLVVEGYRFLSSGTLVEEEVLDSKTIFTCVPDFELLLLLEISASALITWVTMLVKVQ
jgi:hypothetical protein